MFQDEASFGRISTPRNCWCAKGVRPHIPSLKIREYVHVFGAVEPLTGEFCSLIFPTSSTACMNIFLKEVSDKYKKDIVYLICDQAPWHKSKDLEIPKNIKILFIPPATPELNPIEQVWAYIRTNYFANKTFSSLDSFVDSLCDILANLPLDDLKSITLRDWILSMF